MLSYTELKKGQVLLIDDQPYEVLETAFLRMQQRKAVVQAKFKNLLNGKITERNIHQSESFEEAEVEKEPMKFLYNHRDEYFFSDPKDPAKRFSLKSDVVGERGQFFKPNTEMTAMKINDRIISINMPIKMEFKVKEAPPNDRGDTSGGGRKLIELETGAKVTAPLFISTGDTVLVNTETGEYVERVEKGK
ncbi:MAG: elongation factor P [Candidatus Harrisonbacteria bacterium]|nr:elongation factor P [Candidatus Harrisonbacteria bacterium]